MLTNKKTYIGAILLWTANLTALYIGYKSTGVYWVFLTNVVATIGSLTFKNIQHWGIVNDYRSETGRNLYIDKFYSFYGFQLIMSYIFFGLGYIFS
jgi:hypothetical protein